MLRAATKEFAATGPEGARVNEIARLAHRQDRDLPAWPRHLRSDQSIDRPARGGPQQGRRECGMTGRSRWISPSMT
jgi:hypothetical protein